MLVDRYGNKIQQGNVLLASGDFVNGWDYVTIPLSDNIANFRALVIEYLRKDGNKGYMNIPVINGTIGSRFDSSETENGNFRYIMLNVQSQTSNSLTISLSSWLNSSSSEMRTIKAVYGMQ